jgi:hypothetical protein
VERTIIWFSGRRRLPAALAASAIGERAIVAESARL